MKHVPSVPHAALLAGLTLAGGCLGTSRALTLTEPTASPAPASGEVDVEFHAADVELVVQGAELDLRAREETRAHVARMLTQLVGQPTTGAERARTRLAIEGSEAPLLVVAPFRQLTFAFETELPGGRRVRSQPRTVAVDDDELLALETWGMAASLAQGALALGLIVGGAALAANDPTLAAYTLLFSALPAATAALTTAVLAFALRGHSQSHERDNASNALLEAALVHAAEIRDDLVRAASPAAPPDVEDRSAVELRLDDETGCVSALELERDLQALVPASPAREARFTLDVGVEQAAGDQRAVQLRLVEEGASAPLAERQLVVARADCGTLPRVIARIVRRNIEASSPAGAAP